MPELTFDRYYRYDDLTGFLRAFAEEYPALVALESAGRSFEGRDIWLVTVTNTATGPHNEKPAMWIDANIHATELTGSTAVLHLIHRLVTGYGSDDKVTRTLDTRCFYLVPRINPDGAELALAIPPKYIRSSVRPYPRPDEQDGLHEHDVDGDGRILAMRIEDPNGNWKPHPEEPRLLVARQPDEEGDGPYYRLLPEGTVRNFDGVLVPVAPRKEGLDLNRNYPVEWRPEGNQRGAGPYPTSEPEIRSLVQAITDRPNICSFIQYHTMSGVHLRPYGTKDDEQLPTEDLRVYKEIGKRATEITGYKAVSVYHDFRYDPKDTITGVADDWMYDHLGVIAWTTEFWSPQDQAGLGDVHFIEWWNDHPVEHDLALLRWNDEALDGRGYVAWYPFDHPQLGPVELGGWDEQYCWRNPPPHLLEKEIAPHADLALFHLLISPRLELHSLDVAAVGDGAWRIRLVVHNTGWLPTNVTQKAIDRKAVLPLEAEITVPDGAELASGDRKVELGQLRGRALKRTVLGAGVDPTSDRAKAEWVVRGPVGAAVKVEARHPRAGVVRVEVPLGG